MSDEIAELRAQVVSLTNTVKELWDRCNYLEREIKRVDTEQVEAATAAPGERR